MRSSGWERQPPGRLRNLRPAAKRSGAVGNTARVQMGCVTSGPACAGAAGNTVCLVGCVTPPPGASASGKGEHCQEIIRDACRCSSDGLRNLLSRLRGCGWEHHLPGGLRNPSPRCFGVGEGGTLPGKNHKSQLAAGSKADGLRNLQSRLRGCGGNTIPPGRLRNLAPGACARGRGNTARVS